MDLVRVCVHCAGAPPFAPPFAHPSPHPSSPLPSPPQSPPHTQREKERKRERQDVPYVRCARSFSCMPQSKDPFPQPDTRTPAEKAEFDLMLNSIADLYLTSRVLILLDGSYSSRFWVHRPYHDPEPSPRARAPSPPSVSVQGSFLGSSPTRPSPLILSPSRPLTLSPLRRR